MCKVIYIIVMVFINEVTLSADNDVFSSPEYVGSQDEIFQAPEYLSNAPIDEQEDELVDEENFNEIGNDTEHEMPVEVENEEYNEGADSDSVEPIDQDIGFQDDNNSDDNNNGDFQQLSDFSDMNFDNMNYGDYEQGFGESENQYGDYDGNDSDMYNGYGNNDYGNGEEGRSDNSLLGNFGINNGFLGQMKGIFNSFGNNRDSTEDFEQGGFEQRDFEGDFNQGTNEAASFQVTEQPMDPGLEQTMTAYPMQPSTAEQGNSPIELRKSNFNDIIDKSVIENVVDERLGSVVEGDESSERPKVKKKKKSRRTTEIVKDEVLQETDDEIYRRKIKVNGTTANEINKIEKESLENTDLENIDKEPAKSLRKGTKQYELVKSTGRGEKKRESDKTIVDFGPDKDGDNQANAVETKARKTGYNEGTYNEEIEEDLEEDNQDNRLMAENKKNKKKSSKKKHRWQEVDMSKYDGPLTSHDF